MVRLCPTRRRAGQWHSRDLSTSCLGNAEALYALGYMYNIGEGVPQDDVQAVAWYQLAAEQGNAVAQAQFGVKYDNGEGVPADYVQALDWYRLAADPGATAAQYNLGGRVRHRPGSAAGLRASPLWFNLAAAQGDEYGAKSRDSATSLMTQEQIAEAQKLAREWIVAHPKP